MESEVVDTGSQNIQLLQNQYATGDDVTIKYRTGATAAACQAASWSIYTAPFASSGYVQVRLENQVDLLSVSGTNSRYLINGLGEPVFLAGWNYWNFVQDGGDTNPPPAFDFDAAVSHTLSHGLNHMQFYQWCHAKHISWYMRYQPFARTGPGNALDGGLKFDLTSWDSNYFDRVRNRIIQCGQNGIYVTINFWHGFSYNNAWGSAWSANPYHASNNINSINGDSRSTGHGFDCYTLANSAVTAIQESYVEHMIDVLNDLDNVIWHICEEPDGSYSDGSGHTPAQWTEYFVDYVHTYEATKPKQHPVLWSGGAAMPDATLLASDADCIAPGSELLSDGTKVVLNDTDHIIWDSEDAQWPWRAFCLGNSGFWIMDGGYSDYDDQDGPQTYANSEGIRTNNGYALALSQLADLLHMQPQNGGTNPSNTGYCLYPVSSSYHEYILFQPSNSNATLDLSSESGGTTFNIRKINVSDGSADTAQTTTGGASRTITQPSGWTSGWAAWIRPA